MPGTKERRLKLPPSRQEASPEEIWAPIEHEARRQLDNFYPVLDKEASKRLLFLLRNGIFSMWSRGAARVAEDGTVEFWNPHEGVYQAYDEEYNDLMMGLFRKTMRGEQAA
jgi:hypothetical protein